MREQASKAIKMLLLLTLLTGILYPLLVSSLAQLIFPGQARGSLVYEGNQARGSRLIGQSFQGMQYFHSRPSAAGKQGYDASSSGGSNLGPTSAKLLQNVKQELNKTRKINNINETTKVPVDLVTASASGMDPHLSPEAAYAQVGRVARERHMDAVTLNKLVKDRIEERQFGILGEPRINVLELNMALDQIAK